MGSIERESVVLRIGRESGQWPVSRVGDVAEKIAMGPFGSSIKVDTFVPVGVPVVNGKHLSGTRVSEKPGFDYITEEHADRLANSNVRPGDIVFTHRGTIGQVSLVPRNARHRRYVVSQSQMYVRCDESRILPEFAAYWFASRQGQHALLANSSQVGVPSIAQPVSYLKTIEIPVPPMADQRAIAHVLGTLDDKIELNRRMNETLEATVQALFKSWFVDFDPVRAKMEGRDKGLPRDIGDLFPDRFVDSEMGEIPKGWALAPLKELIEVNPKRTLRRGDVGPYLPMADMPTRGHMPVSVDRRAFGSGMRFANGDTLVARITPCLENGKTAYVDFLGDDEVGWGSTEYIVLKPRPPLPDQFAYCLARSTAFREFAIQNMSGTSGCQRVPAAAVKGLLMVAPPVRLAALFAEVAEPLFKRASRAAGESGVLAHLRDTLLPKLISGNVRVPPEAVSGAAGSGRRDRPPLP